MSWQLVSFLILAAVLLAGFGWYERSRPPAQVVALVAALAALAIAGRVAFAAFPNVKPTTDIVIFAGYALGPAAGFAVGAFSALISNFWFGQGPWTPWQMAAWGLCGVLGAALALGTRNVGRLTLAAVCGLAAVGYGAILNFSLMATYGSGSLSWERFWLLEGRAIPFEVAHATGNVVLALAAGPAMIRMLIRFRERFEWRRGEVGAATSTGAVTPGSGSGTGGAAIATTGRVVAILVAVLLLGAFASTRAEAAPAGGTEAATAWLEGVQNSDGGWGEKPGAKSAQEMTGWAMLGLEAAGVNPQDVTSPGGKSPVDYLQGAIGEVQSPGDLARTILALEGAGVEPREFGSRNLVAALLAKRRKDGSYEGWPNSTAYAVLALRSAGIANVSDSIGWLREAQNEDGGWGDTAGAPSNPDGTGAVLQAMDPSGKPAKKAVGYLRQIQQPGGGYRLGGNGALNTQSTAWAVRGAARRGRQPGGVQTRRQVGARIPRSQPGCRRPLPVLVEERPVAGLGDRPGAGGGGEEAPAAGSAAAGADAAGDEPDADAGPRAHPGNRIAAAARRRRRDAGADPAPGNPRRSARIPGSGDVRLQGPRRQEGRRRQ